MVRISPLLYMASWILSVCLALCCLRCTALTLHYISFGLNDLNADCVSSAVTSFSSVAGVRSSRCDHLPVGVGRRSAPLLRSSRSLSFTTRNWSTNNENSNILMVECYSIPCWFFFFISSTLNSPSSHCKPSITISATVFTFQSWTWI